MSRPKVVRRTRPFSPNMHLGPWVVLPSHQDFTFPQTHVRSAAPTQRPFHSAINTHAVITPSFQSSLERKANHTGWAEIRLSIIMKLSATSKGWAAGESTIYHSCAAPAIICTSPRRRAVGGGQRPSGLGACTAGSGKAAFPVGREHGFQVIRGQPLPVCVLTTSTSIQGGALLPLLKPRCHVGRQVAHCVSRSSMMVCRATEVGAQPPHPARCL